MSRLNPARHITRSDVDVYRARVEELKRLERAESTTRTNAKKGNRECASSHRSY